jgi:hypothetical protein
MKLDERIRRLERAAATGTLNSEQIQASAAALLAQLQAHEAPAPLEPVSEEEENASKASLLALLKQLMQEHSHAAA